MDQIDVSGLQHLDKDERTTAARLAAIPAELGDAEEKSIKTGKPSAVSEKLISEKLRLEARRDRNKTLKEQEVDARLIDCLKLAPGEVNLLEQKQTAIDSEQKRLVAECERELEAVRLRFTPRLQELEAQRSAMAQRRGSIVNTAAFLLFEALRAVGLSFDERQLTERCAELRQEQETAAFQKRQNEAAASEAEATKPGLIDRIAGFFAPAPESGAGFHVGGVERR